MSCPDIKTCPVPITREFFIRVCNTKQYSNCHHYARHHGELKAPIGWIQKITVEAHPHPESYPKEVELR